MKNLWKKGMSAAVALLMIGCSKTAEPEAICGGTLDNSAPNAPKVIESTEITGFSVEVYLGER